MTDIGNFIKVCSTWDRYQIVANKIAFRGWGSEKDLSEEYVLRSID